MNENRKSMGLSTKAGGKQNPCGAAQKMQHSNRGAIRDACTWSVSGMEEDNYFFTCDAASIVVSFHFGSSFTGEKRKPAKNIHVFCSRFTR